METRAYPRAGGPRKSYSHSPSPIFRPETLAPPPAVVFLWAMPPVPGLRSPYAKVGRLVYFGRMLDKIRLFTAQRLPADYLENYGDGHPGMFDTRCCEFLRVEHKAIATRVLSGGSDEEILAWTEAKGGRRGDDECQIWNSFLIKRGWHDSAATGQRLQKRIADSGLQDKPIETFFDYIDFDEGRDPVAARAWEQV